MSGNAVAKEAVRNILLGVIDPELGDNIVDSTRGPGRTHRHRSHPARGHRRLHRPPFEAAGLLIPRPEHTFTATTSIRTLKQRQGALSR